MRRIMIVISGLMLPCIAWFAPLRAQAPEAEEGTDSTAKVVRPIQVEVLSLQVSKLRRDELGAGIKPVTGEKVLSWLSNSGTAVDLRLKVDRPITQFEAHLSRLVRFADDKGRDLTRTPGRWPVNTFFDANKPIIVKPGPELDEAEVILRGYGTPAPGATKLQVHADLVFLSASDADERVVERKGLEPTPEATAMLGPLRIRFRDPQQVPLPAPVPPRFPRLARPPMPAAGGVPGGRRVAFACERSEKRIKSLACLDPEGRQIAALEGESFDRARGGTIVFPIPEIPRITLRVVYYEKSETITVPIRLETGVGF
jgi:hypothetical protein